MPRKTADTRKRARSAPLPSAARVAKHRSRQASSGRKRVEVVVPRQDIALIRRVAERLRAGPSAAAAVRSALATAVAPPTARTGKELVALLQSAPLDGATLEIRRDPRPARVVDFEW